tara:strand:+ start:561 stop:1004 length:444 start_codon:yes stop_codon:yes gene_type:complete
MTSDGNTYGWTERYSNQVALYQGKVWHRVKAVLKPSGFPTWPRPQKDHNIWPSEYEDYYTHTSGWFAYRRRNVDIGRPRNQEKIDNKAPYEVYNQKGEFVTLFPSEGVHWTKDLAEYFAYFIYFYERTKRQSNGPVHIKPIIPTGSV